MGRYIIKRIIQMIPVFFIATFVVFFIVRVLPGDPIQANFGERRIPDSLREAYVRRYNLDEPLWKQYVLYITGILQGDFGESIANQRQITEIFAERAGRSARLAGLIVFLQGAIGIPLGVLAARNKDRFFDNAALVTTVTMLAAPTLIVCVFGQWLFGLKLGWFPISGIDDGWKSYLLPALCVGVSSIAVDLRLVRASVIDTYSEDYVRTARAKGAGDRRVLGIHALRNALIPEITSLGLTLGALLGGLLVTESVFNIPGLGFTIVRAIPTRDNSIIVGFTAMLIVAYLIINLIVDILYAVLDPRIRYD